MTLIQSEVKGEESSLSRITRYTSVALKNALNSLADAGVEVTSAVKMCPRPGEPLSVEPEEPLIWRQPFSMAEDAVLWIVAGGDLWKAAGRMILGAAGTESVTDGDCRSAWHEIAGRTVAAIASTMASDLGNDAKTVGGAEASDWPGDNLSETVLEVRCSEQVWEVRVFWTVDFAEACAAVALAPQEAGSSGPADDGTSKTLDLLMDVALPVSVSFGRTSLQIREVLKLNTGSVIELDRLVSEPVEVIVNNCVIARGEVVVVDGNYGVRVVQLSSREDRIRSGIVEASSRLGMSAR